MTAAEYLTVLKSLAEFSHSEPIPEANKSLNQKVSDLLDQHLTGDQRNALRESVRIVLRQGDEETIETMHGLSESDISSLGGGSRHDWMGTVHDLMARMNETLKPNDVGAWLDIHFGVLPIGTLDAVALRVPNSSENLIVFNEGMFLFLFLFIKIAITAAAEPVVTDSQGNHKFVVSAFVKNRLKDLFVSYLLLGHPKHADKWFVKGGDQALHLAILTIAAEMFFLSHEVTHILSGDLVTLDSTKLESGNLESFPTPLKAERNADFMGARLTIGSMLREYDLRMIVSGIEIAICARQMVENSIRLFRHEKIPAESILYNHRSLVLDQQLTPSFATKFGPRGLEARTAMEQIRILCQFLWESLERMLVKKRDDGAVLATVWSPLL
jgi:hypothetical protein